MADTQPLAPTDAELDELRQANGGKLNFVTFSEFRTIARAALAKWGTPSGSGKVVAHRLVRKSLSGEWASDARDWSDGPPSRALVDSICADNGRWRIDVAYASPQQEAQEPDFWTVCAQYEYGEKTGWVPLPGYSNETEHGVKNLVLQAARKEGYKGTVTGRLQELGWEIQPVYLAPQPSLQQPVAVPLTDAQIRAMAREHPAEDLCGWSYRMGIADTERHHGIKGGQHGTE